MRALETDRLRLRWFVETDAAFILALVNDPSWIANIGDRGLETVEDARAWIAEKLVASYWRDGFGLWALERKSDGELVGMCGLVERETLPAIDVGYALAARFRGEGYAREAARASLEYGRDVLGKRRILAIVRPENHASIRVLESIGMVADGVRILAGEERPSALFAWGALADSDPTGDATTEIDAVSRRLFACFSNHSGISHVAAVPSLFTHEAVVTVIRRESPRGIEVSSVRDFVAPRASLLLDGRLVDFEERELTSQTVIARRLAYRSSRYTKAGTLDGRRYEGAGTKHFQLVQTTRGWKIAALAWEDDPEVPARPNGAPSHGCPSNPC
jgi:RimJ/RimL family protein N-acetyltransferase